ncbi:MAG: tetratricopeptide repeat protein, partial [Planctomyces sp.]
ETIDRALAIMAAHLGSTSTALRIPLLELARIHQDRGESAEALSAITRAVDKSIRVLGAEHRVMADWYAERALMLLEDGNPAAARELLDRAMAIDARHHPADSMIVAHRHGTLAMVRLRQG